jgi:hypothetical protein
MIFRALGALKVTAAIAIVSLGRWMLRLSSPQRQHETVAEIFCDAGSAATRKLLPHGEKLRDLQPCPIAVPKKGEA